MSDFKHLHNPIFRDLPTSLIELRQIAWERPFKETVLYKQPATEKVEPTEINHELIVHDDGAKPFLKKLWPIVTTGAGLFSDGYISGSTSTISLCLSKIYGKQYHSSRAIQNVSSISFVGTIVGQLIFGYMADKWSRKKAILIGTTLLIITTILCAGAWGVGTTSTHPGGLFAALTAYRFFLGLAVSSEYSSSSPAAVEAAALLPAGKRHRWFGWLTRLVSDIGYLINAFVPLVLVWIFSSRHLNAVWRITVGLGALPPFVLFFLRLKYKEDKQFEKTKFNKKTPYWLILKFYWFRILVVSIVWFLYDFTAYAFSIYSSIVVNAIIGEKQPIYKTFGWNVVLNLFYIPGSILGSLAADYIGPRNTLAFGVLLQAAIGFIIAGVFAHLKTHVGAFIAAYGCFLAVGNFSGGVNLGLVASKTGCTPVRGQIYGIAASIGKVGGFVGSYIFPTLIVEHGGYNSVSGLQTPYWVSASLCVLMALISYFFLPPLDQDSIMTENAMFLQYLEHSGYDMSQLGDTNGDIELSNSSETTRSSKEVAIEKVTQVSTSSV